MPHSQKDLGIHETSFRLRAAAVAASLAFILLNAAAVAGGTPENIALIIDPTDPISMYVGNYYKNARNIPDSNVFYIRSAATTYSSFTSTVQAAFTSALAQRKLQDHVDYVVLAPLNSYSMGSSAAFGSAIDTISLPAAYAVIPLSGTSVVTSLQNPYGASATSLYPSGDPPRAFHSQQAYLNGSPSADPSAGRMYIGAMLGYTQGPVGNTVPELLSMIDRSVAADASRPSGTFYFMNNTADGTRNVRACSSGIYSPCGSGSNPNNYIKTSSSIGALGGVSLIPSGALPPESTSGVMGVMSGFQNADIPGTNLTFVPGAFADHFTSYGGVLDGTQSQTTVQRWIAAGASGSAGSVEEPEAYVQKFPSADLHYYYYQGMSLGEAYLRSVEALPVEMLLYGDPLTRPFAYLPAVTVAVPSGLQSGPVTITPSASTANPGASIANFTLLVDGLNVGNAAPGQSFSLDTQLLDDGPHDIRVLAYDNTAVQNVGRWTGTLDTSNYGRAATLAASPSSGSLVQQFSFSYSATGGQVVEVHLCQSGRVIASSASASGVLQVYGQNLGAGTSAVRLEVWYDDGRIGRSAPVSVNVTSSGIPSGETPVAYSYSKHLTSLGAYLIELPASYDIAPGAAVYTVLNTPTQATVVQPNSGGPYVIVQPKSGAAGSEALQFTVTNANGTTSNTATVTLTYSSVKIIPLATKTAAVTACCWNRTQAVATQVINGALRAGTWSGPSSSWSDLTPAGASSSVAYAAQGGQIVGIIQSINSTIHGGYWTSGASSWVDLNTPEGYSAYVSGVYVNATDNLPLGQQVGYAGFPPNRGYHALIWYGSAASLIDVSPPGIADSGLIATDGFYQVGFTLVGNNYHAGFWNGTPDSWVDVQPPGADYSFPTAMDAVPPYESVGYAGFNGAIHAGYWSSAYGGSAGTWVDLNPATASGSKAIGAYSNRQVGYAIVNGVTHASIWSASADTWVDLGQQLPPAYTGGSSFATAIRHDAEGTYVLGQLETPTGDMGVIWRMP